MRYRVTCTYRLVITREIEAETEEEAEDQAWEIRQVTNILECECVESEQKIEPIEEGPHRCGVCGLPAEGVEEVCDCTCPNCGKYCFDDAIFASYGRCYDCHKKWQLRPVTKDDDEKENPSCSSSSTFPCI